MLLLLLALSALALAWILQPFYGAILWAIIIAVLFGPLYQGLLLRLKGHRNAAAALVMLLVLVVAVLPVALMMASLAREASLAYQQINSGHWNPVLYLRIWFEAQPSWAMALLRRAGVMDFDTLQAQLSAALTKASQLMATEAFGLGLNTFGFVADLGVTLYLAFFLLRDGHELALMLQTALPVPPPSKQELATKFMAVVRATVKGSLLIAAIQGLLGGFAFWVLEVKGALLWGVLMAFLSLLPMIGAGLVWLPVAAYFVLTGAYWQAFTLVAYGLLVIGLIDNLLRPVLVGKNAGMPDYVVMITTLGGMAVFGVNGFILGPVIAAMFMAVWQLWVKTTPQAS
jgi:predicted PurR-regulated permease PerM